MPRATAERRRRGSAGDEQDAPLVDLIAGLWAASARESALLLAEATTAPGTILFL